MADRVVLHIGTMKSGTTYLQDVLSSGALEPADGWYVGGSFEAQNLAVRELLGPERSETPLWDGLLEEMDSRDGTAVVSHEFLSFMGPERIASVVSSLPTDDVRVVLAVRDQYRAIPAQWQSFARNRGLDDWATYQRRLEESPRDAGPEARRALRSYRRAQHVPGILRRWTGAPGVGSAAVVVVPPPSSDPAELWRRFTTAAGLGEGDPRRAARRSNESLGRASCEVLVMLNRALLPWPKEEFAPLRDTAIEALLPLRAEEGTPVLDERGASLARSFNDAIAEAVARPGLEVVGPLADLSAGAGGDHPATTGPADEGQVRRALQAVRDRLAPDLVAASPDASAAELLDTMVEHLDAHWRR